MPVKFYFAGSMRGEKADLSTYASIIALLRRRGEVLTEHVAEGDGADSGITDREIHDRDMEWLRGCDCVVAEVTHASHGVGYEIGRAVEMGIPVLCLRREGGPYRLSAMLGGSPGVTVLLYTEETLESVLETGLGEAMK